jgi:hypothetical protein
MRTSHLHVTVPALANLCTHSTTKQCQICGNSTRCLITLQSLDMTEPVRVKDTSPLLKTQLHNEHSYAPIDSLGGLHRWGCLFLIRCSDHCTVSITALSPAGPITVRPTQWRLEPSPQTVNSLTSHADGVFPRLTHSILALRILLYHLVLEPIVLALLLAPLSLLAHCQLNLLLLL